MRRLFGAMLLVFGLALALLSFDLVLETTAMGDKRSAFSRLWKRDLIQLEAQGKLPQAFSDVKEVKVKPLNDGAKKLLKNLSHPFSINKNGAHHLEVMIDLWKDNEGYGALMVYSLIDSSGNTIWEMNRTLEL